MKVGIHYPPSAPCHPSVTRICPEESLALEIIRGLNHSLQWKITEIVILPQTGFGVPENGTWTRGRLGALNQGVVDVMAYGMSYNSVRAQYFAYSTPFGHENPTFTLPAPRVDETATAMRIFNVFEPTYWLISFMSLFLLFVTMKLWAILLVPAGQTQIDQGRNEDLTFWRIFEHYIGQNGFHQAWRPTKSVTLILILFSLLSFFTLALYQSFLLTLLVTPSKSRPLVSSVSDLLAQVGSGKLNLLLQNEFNSYHQQILSSDNVVLAKLRTELYDNPNAANLSFVASELQVRKLIQTYEYVMLTDEGDSRDYAGRYCDITLLKANGFPNPTTSFLLRVNDTEHLDDLNQALAKNQGRITALIERNSRAYETERRFCKGLNYDTVGKPLHFISLAGSLLIFTIGIVCAVLCFLWEILNWFLLRIANGD